MAIKNKQLVVMHYELKVNGTQIETNFDGSPIEFSYGTGEIIPGLEEAIKDMNEGETKEVKIVAQDAYGKHDPSLTEKLPISDFEGIDLEIGLVLEADDDNGNLIKATVTEVTKDEVTVDYNHPFADCDLDFKVFIKRIV
ncbi:FKBP-type peptidyl-prolyl cis-trans isomerase [Halarcobacter sp.]|uniref:FKBP-type peptidyl-prolyl cis-trans isomerase n=1 Tax=Halarcobacter sp. TaxID=2321133 RepID=UPI002AA79B89|nr:FKBP-type peptidyl-prolyl cis-trans isomerase [Halarcobacter sp.]